MNLLYLKRKALSLGILIFITAWQSIYANDSIPKLSFLEQCQKSDAYLKHSYTDITYYKSWSGYRKQTSIMNKMVINNTAGVESFAFLNLPEFISRNIKEFEVKTLKSNGKVIALDSSLVFKKDSNSKRIGAINYPIPAVEPGDTIETSYIYTEYIKDRELMDYVNLYANVPSINTEYTLRTGPDLKVRYKPYNNFPEPQILTNDTLVYCVFKMEKVKGISNNDNTCIPCELPYLYYSLENDKNKLTTWKDIYNHEFNAITQPLSFDDEKSSYYRRWKKDVIGSAKDSTKYYKLKLLLQNITNNMEMGLPQKEELIKSSGYFLKKKRFDPLSIKRLYRQLLEDLEIEYSAVFARSKRSGPIDPYYIRMGEYDHIFFAYDNGKSSVNLLYPNEAHYKYQINEIPTSIYNTEAIMAKPYLTKKLRKSDKFINYDFKLAEVDSVVLNTIKLPGMSVNHNYIRQVYYTTVDLKEKKTAFKYRFSISGGLSTDLRAFYAMLDQNKEASDFYDALSEFEGNNNAIEIDTITSSVLVEKSPFKYSVVGKGTLKESVTFLNDSIVSLALKDLIQHSQIETQKDTDDLNYYLDYSYADYSTFIFNFPKDVQVIGFDKKTDVVNDVGSYQFDLDIGNKKLTIRSNYKISKDMIPKAEHKQLEALNTLIKEVKNRRLIIKLKT